jgi:molecular chaperone GrpE
MFKSKKEKLEKELLKEELNNIENVDKESQEIPEPDLQGGIESGPEAAELEKKVNQFKDLYLRKAAEFENYKRRTENEISNVYRFANENLISEMLPVLDDFNRVIKNWDDKHEIESFKKGIEILYDKFNGLLEKQGLKEIDAEGKPFDVNLHEAVMQIESNDYEPNTVTSVVENGYYLKDKVLRQAKVIVSKVPEEKKNRDE